MIRPAVSVRAPTLSRHASRADAIHGTPPGRARDCERFWHPNISDWMTVGESSGGSRARSSHPQRRPAALDGIQSPAFRTPADCAASRKCGGDAEVSSRRVPCPCSRAHEYGTSLANVSAVRKRQACARAEETGCNSETATW